MGEVKRQKHTLYAMPAPIQKPALTKSCERTPCEASDVKVAQKDPPLDPKEKSTHALKCWAFGRGLYVEHDQCRLLLDVVRAEVTCHRPKELFLDWRWRNGSQRTQRLFAWVIMTFERV